MNTRIADSPPRMLLRSDFHYYVISRGSHAHVKAVEEECTIAKQHNNSEGSEDISKVSRQSHYCIQKHTSLQFGYSCKIQVLPAAVVIGCNVL